MGCGGWAAKKSAKHCYVCDSYGCLGTTALPEQKFADFFQTRYSDISYIYICQISFTLLRVFHSGRGNNNRHLFNSSFTHIFHPVGFPLTDKSFLILYPYRWWHETSPGTCWRDIIYDFISQYGGLVRKLWIYLYICMYKVVYYIYPANACMFRYIYKVREKLKSENNVRDVLFL